MNIVRRCRWLTVVAFLCVGAVSADEPTPPSYQRHVAALFSRLGCNGGTCHGAVQGQNGFKLSLFSADADRDYDRLLHESAGRRINLHDPDSSLLLLKASARVGHQGGKRLDLGSFEHRVLRDWLAAGAPIDAAAPAHVERLRIEPAEKIVSADETYRLKVEATFADGSIEDVTKYCTFTAVDNQVATVDESGLVRGKGVGDSALIVRYRAVPALAQVLVPRLGQRVAEAKPHNFIDHHVLKKLERLNLPPAPLADDATFLRRAHLDIAGSLPEPDEVRSFVADRDPAKRAKKIDQLLTSPGHAALWTLKFSDLWKGSDYGVYADALSQEADAPRFQAWIRARLEENIPYDELVERVLTATSREGRSLDEYTQEIIALFDGNGPGRADLDVYKKRRTLDLYWQRRGAEGVTGAMQVAHAFLGIRLECAQCHRHPHDVWQQDDFLSFANFFMRVRKVGFQGDTDKKYPEQTAIAKKLGKEAKDLEQEVKKRKEDNPKKQDDAFKKETARLERRGKNLVEVARRLQHAEAFLLPPAKPASVTSPLGTQSSSANRLLGETTPLTIAAEDDPRAAVVAWMRRPDNPFFARAIVNRVWAHYFGRGIIDPPDHLSPFNPATHPELLKELTDGFVEHNYDLRWLHRAIVSSRTYQQSGLASKDNIVDRGKNYAYFAYRRLPAEVLVDALNQATGVGENLDMKFHNWPANTKAVEMPYAPRNDFVAFMLDAFGKPKRNSAVQCDCERDGSPSVFQVLALGNHPRLWEKIADPKGRVAQVLTDKTDDRERLDELFLAVLSRFPDHRERAACGEFLKDAASPAQGYQGILWSLLNTREFLLQH
jgi:hypothetical protein